MTSSMPGSESELLRSEVRGLLAEGRTQLRQQLAKFLIYGIGAAIVAAGAAVWAWIQAGGPASALDAATKQELRTLKDEIAWSQVKNNGKFDVRCEYRFKYSSGNIPLHLFQSQHLQPSSIVYIDVVSADGLYLFADDKRLEVTPTNVTQVNITGGGTGVIELEKRCSA